MITSHRGQARYFFLFACTIAAFVTQAPTALATTPFSPTIISQTSAGWDLEDDRVSGARILVMGRDHKTRLELSIWDALPKSDFDKYVHHTTAGPRWADDALAYFVTIAGKPHFCVRTWWDRRIVIDLAAAKQVPDRGMEAVLDAEEIKTARIILKGCLKTVVAAKSDQDIPLHIYFRLKAAAHLVGCIQHKEAIPWLRKLESLGFATTYTMGEYGPGELKAGEISPQNYSTHDLRRVVQLSLRRLGETPAELPVTSFKPEGSDSAFQPRKSKGPRVERVESIKLAMTPTEVLNILGAPDYVDTYRRMHSQGPWEAAWRYDLDAHPAYTLLVIWKGHTVGAIDKVTPALWNLKHLTDDNAPPAFIEADGSIGDAKALYTDAFKGKISRLK